MFWSDKPRPASHELPVLQKIVLKLPRKSFIFYFLHCLQESLCRKAYFMVKLLIGLLRSVYIFAQRTFEKVKKWLSQTSRKSLGPISMTVLNIIRQQRLFIDVWIWSSKLHIHLISICVIAGFLHISNATLRKHDKKFYDHFFNFSFFIRFSLMANRRCKEKLSDCHGTCILLNIILLWLPLEAITVEPLLFIILYKYFITYS